MHFLEVIENIVHLEVLSLAYIGEILVGLFLLAIGGVVKVSYDYRTKIFVWMKKQKLKIFPANFNIAFSLDFREGLNSGNYFNEIKKNFLRSIDSVGLQKHIRIRDFSDIKQFANREEAEFFRAKKSIDLIIWGGFTSDSLKINGEHISKINLSFTFGHPDIKEGTIGSMLILDISSKLAVKNYWQIVEKNSLKDIEIVSNNIFDIATYILALTLKLYGRIWKSIELFERLYNDLVSRKDNFSKHIVPHLLNCYSLVITEIGINRKNIKTGKEFCNKYLKFERKSFFALSNLAIFQYKTGEHDETEKTVDLLLKYHPKNPLTELDVAFIRILQGNYNSAFKHYERMLKFGAINFNPQEVIEFLSLEYSVKKEPALLYGIAMISKYYGDETSAMEDFKMFLKKANEDKYKPMYRKAKIIIKRLK